jgi:hephaestin
MLQLVLAALIAASPSAPRTFAPNQPVSPGKTRVYYIAADELIWDYAPSGINQITGKPFDEFQQMFTKPGPQQIGSKSKKALFREYTDATFSTLKKRSPEEEYLGFLGPVIRAEIGDSIRVVFRNNGTHPYSMHPHGVIYDKSSEGSGYADNTAGVARPDAGVAPGATYT